MPSLPGLDLANAPMYQTPTMLPLQRRSEYLADAIASINQTAQQGIRSPQALGTNLLAEAILQYGQHRNDKRMFDEMGRTRSGLADMLMGRLNGGGATPTAAPGAPQAPAPGGSGNMADAAPATLGAPQQPQTPQPQATPSAAPYSGVPHQVVTPDQIHMAEQLLQSDNPALFQQGMEMAQALLQRQTSPVPLSPGHTFRPDGSVQDLEENWQSVPGGSPADAAQQNTVTGRIDHQNIPGVAGPNGSFLQGGGYVTPPTVVNGQVLPYGAPTPNQMFSGAQALLDAPPVAAYRTLRTKAEPILQHPEDYANGAGDIALIESLQEALNGNPNLAVREGFVHTIAESQGFIAGLMGQAQNAASRGETGFLDPSHRRRMIDLIQNAVNERYQAANAYVGEMSRAVGPLGYPPESIPQIPPPPQGMNAQPPAASAPPAAAPPRLPAGLSQEQGVAWLRQHGVQRGQPFLDPNGVRRVSP